MKRRDIIAAMAAAPLLTMGDSAGHWGRATAAVPDDPGVMDSGKRRLAQFGLQLSTITPVLMADFEGALSRVAEIGYTQVEFSALGFLGRPAKAALELLGQFGLHAPVGRIAPRLPEDFAALSREDQYAVFRTRSAPDQLLENVRHALQDAAVLEQRHLVLPVMMPEQFATLDGVKATIDLLSRAGELCAAAGVRFAYHNHDWECVPVEGVIPLDLMLETVPAELMSVQLDVYWVARAGGDPRDYFAAYPGRIPSCHLKDMDAAGGFEDVGHGTLDIPSIVAAAMACGTEFYFVERDNPPEPMRTAQRAYAYLEQMRF